MKNPVIPKFRTSIQHLKVLKNTEKTYLNVEKSLTSLSRKEEALEKSKSIHKSKLTKVVKDKEDWMKKFSESLPLLLRSKFKLFLKEEFPVTLSYVDFSPDPTAHLTLEGFIQKISIIPFCRYRENSFSKRLNPYDENIKDIEIEKYGICVLIDLSSKDGDKNKISVDIELKSFKIDKKKGTAFWNIKNISGRFDGVMIDSIQYQSISSKESVKKFKKMIGFTELSKLAKELL